MNADTEAPQTPRSRPTITICGGLLPHNVDDAERALLADGRDPIFQRGNVLGRLVRQAPMTRGVHRGEGALVFRPLDVAYLVDRLTLAVAFYRVRKDGELVAIDCPSFVARTLLAREGSWRAPLLLGIVEAPTLRDDGSILDTPGYDEVSRLVFDPGGVTFPPIPREPTRDEAIEALALFDLVLRGFPWVAESDRSAALAAIVTALVRQSLPTAPMFVFRAPKMASGKSLLADVVALIATGRVAPVMSQGRDEEEDRKRMLSLLLEGAPVTCLDNIARPLGGSVLCSVLTQEVWKDRVLGRSGTATVPTCTTWLATGNNLQIVGDLTTRVIPCDLDPRCEHPEERPFAIDLRTYVPQHRAALVVAVLTVVRAYIVAGRPDQRLPVFGRFEDWSGLVRNALVWCDLPDPCAGRARLEETDPVRQQLRAVLVNWHRVAGRTVMAAADLAAKASGEGADEALRAALEDVAGATGTQINTRRLGSWLSRHVLRVEAGLRIERMGDRQGVAQWRVAPVEDAPVGLVGSVGLSQSVAAKTKPARTAGPTEFDPRPTERNPPNPRNPPSHDATRGAVEDAERAERLWPAPSAPPPPGSSLTLDRAQPDLDPGDGDVCCAADGPRSP